MKIMDYTGVLPEQYTGKEIIADASKTCNNIDEAIKLFDECKGRLLNVDQWYTLFGVFTTRFCVVDSDGNSTGKPVEKGNLLRVDIPGPGSSSGDGYDWVIVEELNEVEEEDLQSIAFRVRPTHNPKGSTNNIAHFYNHDATSTFNVTRKSNIVHTTIVDRNIKPNDDTHSIADQIRNLPVAAGAIGLLSKLQWQSLADGLLKKED